MNAGFDNLITLLIFVGIAVASAILNKRRERQQEEEQYPDLPPFPGQKDPTPQRQEPRRKSWEDELRDLLEQAKPPAPPPIPRDSPPPVPYRAPAPVYRPVPPPIQRQEEPEVLTNFEQAQERFTHAGEIHQRIAQQLEDAAAYRHKLVAKKAPAPNAVAAANLLRDRQSIRSAVLAQVILGPPKSLES